MKEFEIFTATFSKLIKAVDKDSAKIIKAVDKDSAKIAFEQMFKEAEIIEIKQYKWMAK